MSAEVNFPCLHHCPPLLNSRQQNSNQAVSDQWNVEAANAKFYPMAEYKAKEN